MQNGVQTQLSGVGWVKHFFDNFVGKPGSITNATNEQGQAVSAANTVIPFHFPTDLAGLLPVRLRRHHARCCSWAACSAGSSSVAWCLLVPLWSTFVYGVDAFLLWGGGYFAQEGALDFSGGFVIHMSAGVSGFVAAWVLGPRLAARPTARHTQQPGHGGGRCRHPLARLERVQRR